MTDSATDSTKEVFYDKDSQNHISNNQETMDYKAKYEECQKQNEELNEYLTLFQEYSNSSIAELEKENKLLKDKINALQSEIDKNKDKTSHQKNQNNALYRYIELLKRYRNDFKTRYEEFQRKVVDLYNTNETLESYNRANNCLLKYYEYRNEKTMEELALLQVYLYEKKYSNQYQVARLKDQLKDTEEQLYVLHLKHQKHNDESMQRRSRLSSSASFSSQEEKPTPYEGANTKTVNGHDMSIAHLLNVDFKRNKYPAFHATVSLVYNLIGYLSCRGKKPKSMKRVAVL